jgi:predicted dehydrogenase
MMTTEPLRLGVIGLGAMGSNHARVLSDLPGVLLVAVADKDKAKANYHANHFHVQGYDDPLTMMAAEKLDAVTIAVPTTYHYSVAMAAIEQGLHLLIEKPISSSVEQGRKLVAAAAQAGVVLTVGHIERFNPAVIALRQRILNGELGRIFQIMTHRASPFPAHVQDVGVVIDLAVHDLDIMRYITASEAIRVHAEIERRVHSTHEDQLIGLLRFANGAIGKVTVNWLTPTKLRELTVIGELGMFVVNYLTQDLTFYENAAVEASNWETMLVLRGVREGTMTRYVVPKKEPLRAELEAFITTIQAKSQPVVTGEDGIMALFLAETVVKAGQEHQTIHLK